MTDKKAKPPEKEKKPRITPTIRRNVNANSAASQKPKTKEPAK